MIDMRERRSEQAPQQYIAYTVFSHVSESDISITTITAAIFCYYYYYTNTLKWLGNINCSKCKQVLVKSWISSDFDIFSPKRLL